MRAHCECVNEHTNAGAHATTFILSEQFADMRNRKKITKHEFQDALSRCNRSIDQIARSLAAAAV